MGRVSKSTRIKREEKALKKYFVDLEENHKENAERLIARAAYQKVPLEDIEAGLKDAIL